MASPLLLLLLPFLLLLAAAYPSSASLTDNSTDFIRRSCNATLYPQLCYTSLKIHSAAVRQDPLALALVAANVSLAKIKEASSHAATLRRGRGEGRVGAALCDCVDLLRTAADLTKQSAAEMRKLGPAAQAGGPGFAWAASNAQTWMSAALTNEDSCVDGFREVAGGGGGAAAAPVKAFRGKVGRVEQYSSNALALLNALVVG